MADLSQKKCEPCHGGIPSLTQLEISRHLKEVSGWQQQDGPKIKKTFQFKDFGALMRFVNQMAELAEAEAHHPDFFVSYNKLEVSIFTHKINGLSVNDFILAAKIDKIKT